MADPAAFKATFSDWKLIKTRGVVQVILEVPLHDSDAAYKVLGGMPEAATERWFAVARLDLTDKPVKPRQKVSVDKKLAQQAGICCANPVFQRFLFETSKTHEMTEMTAAEYVRAYCAIASRSELIPGTDAALLWIDLHGKFLAWKLV